MPRNNMPQLVEIVGLVMIAALLVVALTVISTHKTNTTTVTVTQTVTTPAPTTFTEQEIAGTGAQAFHNYHNAGDPLQARRVTYAERVEVSCRVYDPTIPSVNPGGFWYKIITPPWTGGYVPANTFLNGTVGHHHYVDLQVPLCA